MKTIFTFLLVWGVSISAGGQAFAQSAKAATSQGRDGKCCVRTDPKSAYDCAALDAPTWQTINTPGLSLADALKYTCQRQFTANDQFCKWDTKNPDCMPKTKDPCEERGMVSVKGDRFDLSKDVVLCCTSKNPKEDLLAGKKVCCEKVARPR